MSNKIYNIPEEMMVLTYHYLKNLQNAIPDAIKADILDKPDLDSAIGEITRLLMFYEGIMDEESMNKANPVGNCFGMRDRE